MAIPIVSIIIPVYNVEEYITRCVDSILGQTFTDWECILVDDGSTDRSGQICDEYSKKDKRIHVLHQSNNGVAKARQRGIQEALGEYSIHADGDDWMEHDAIRLLYEMAKKNNADIVIGDFVIEHANGEKAYCKQCIEGYTSQKVLRKILREELFGALWHKLIRHNLYKLYNIEFHPQINYCEDVLVCAQLMKNNLKIVHLPQLVYHYCMENIDSVTRNYTHLTFNMRKMYVNQLGLILGKDYEKDIEIAKLKIKLEAIRHHCLCISDFNKELPVSITTAKKR